MIFLRNKNLYFTLLLIFIANFLFKLIHISYSSLWYDEIISAQDTLLDFGHIKHEAEWDKNPPFYHYLLWIWSKLFGISEIGLRSMSVFFNSLTAVLIYLLVKKITDKTYAVIATLIFSLHPFLYYFSQEARCYSLLIFLVTANLMTLLSLIEKPSFSKAFLLGILNFLIFYTHYVAGLILFCQFIYLIIVFRKNVIYLCIIYLTPIVLVLLRFTRKQYNVLFFSNEMSRAKANVPLAKPENLIQSLNELFISNLILIIFLIFLAYFLFITIKGKHIDRPLSFKLFIIFIPVFCILVLYILGTKTNVYHERYLIFTIPCIIISFLIFRENKIILSLFVIITIGTEVSKIKFGESRKMDYRFCASLTKAFEKKENVNILIQTHDVVNLFTYYYDLDLFKSKNRMSQDYLAQKNIYYIENFNDLQNIHLDKSRPILFFQTYQKENDAKQIMDYFHDQKYISCTTNKIDGVRFSYLKNRN